MSDDVSKICRNDAGSSSDSRLTLQEYYDREVKRLGAKNPILCYTSEIEIFKLSFIDGVFTLEKATQIPDDNTSWDSITFLEHSRFSTLDDFFEEFFDDNSWYIDYRIFKRKTLLPGVLAKHIVAFFNNARKLGVLSGWVVKHANEWEYSLLTDEIKPSERKDYCPHCKNEKLKFSMYPASLCPDCSAKEKFARTGERVEFCNQGMHGGFKVLMYDKENRVVAENNDCSSFECYIDGNKYYASEAKFGGIVIKCSII